MTPSLTDDEVFTAARAFLLAVLPTGIEVVAAQVNRAPRPTSANHVVLTGARREQLAQTVSTPDPENDQRLIGRSTGFHLQIDIYGPAAADNAQTVSTLLHDAYGCDFLRPYGLQPLYCDDGTQMPLVSGEFQWENRWMVRAVLQASPEIAVPTEFADTVITTLVEADRP